MKKSILFFAVIIAFGIGAVVLLSDRSLQTDTTDWLTYTDPERGFSFRYPSTYEIAQHGYDYGDTSIVAVVSSDHTLSKVHQEETPSIRLELPKFDSSYNDDADSLEDYETDYNFQEEPIEYSLQGVEPKPLPDELPGVIIHSSERRDINGTPALKQQYSTGHWTNYGDFNATNEFDNDHYFRYVFFGGNDNFVIMKSSNPLNYRSGPEAEVWAREFEAFLDSIASTFTFSSPN